MFRMLLTITMLAALIIPKAYGGALYADAFDEAAPDQTTPTLASIPAQYVAPGTSVELDLSAYVTGMIGTLTFRAESSNTALATAGVSGNTLTITGVEHGQVNVTVTLGTSSRATASTVIRVTVLASSPWSVSGSDDVYLLEGNVGIGVDDPDERLVVDGRIKAEEIHVEDVTPADYVFEDDYVLMSLDELKDHIQAHGHLPGVASGPEMEAEGVSVSRMQTVLLEKVEELMLYTIDQHGTLVSQRRIIGEQERQLAVQQRHIELLEERLLQLEQSR